MKLYHLKTCDSCKKARKALREADVSAAERDVRVDGFEAGDVAKIVAAVGWEKALNRRSTTWRALDDPDKADMDADKAVSMIEAYPTLLKRPAIMDGDRVTVGWDAAAQATWL